MDELKTLPAEDTADLAGHRIGRRIIIRITGPAGRFAAGVLFTFAVAAAGTALAGLPVLSRPGPMVIAILLAVVYRQIAGYPVALAGGIQFSSKVLLRLAIILYGFRVNVAMILHQGWHVILQDTAAVVLAIAMTALFARWLRADGRLSFLLGVGTGVCGAAAIAAVAPLVKARDEETAAGVGVVALVGTLFAISYTLIRPWIPLTDLQFGLWAGTSLHEIAHVAAAAAPAGQSALGEAILAKLGRVALLVPLSLVLLARLTRRGQSGERAAFTFPWFLLGFIGASLFTTYVPPAPVVLDRIAAAASWLLTTAMVGLGLNVEMRRLLSRAARPLGAMILASVVLSIATYWFTLL
ncbi:MAG: putative sulfate exporter family transporter [Kyrpidia sp.]|nr:putative sulfate exporter family transporter [Kyrpidia sp.]